MEDDRAMSAKAVQGTKAEDAVKWTESEPK